MSLLKAGDIVCYACPGVVDSDYGVVVDVYGVWATVQWDNGEKDTYARRNLLLLRSHEGTKENEMELTPEEQRNIKRVMNDPEPPRLSYSTETCVIAKDTKNKGVYVGGLGAMGVGRMWFWGFHYNCEKERLSPEQWEAIPEVDSSEELESFRKNGY